MTSRGQRGLAPLREVHQRVEDPRTVRTRLRLVETAERLFAEHGINAVSLRDVSAAAGQRNRSAAQYHFGSRQGLVLAILEHRMAAINRDRAARLASDPSGDLRTLVEALVVPLVAAVPLDGTSYYATFLSRAMVDGELRELTFAQEWMSGLRRVLRLLDASLAERGVPARRHRVRFANTMLTHVVADYERASRHRPGPRHRSRQLAGELVDAIVALLDAPEGGGLSWTTPSGD